MNDISCVVIPDVHGRTFWKDAKDYDCDIIFLGDYLDPYGFEGINNVQALDNFKEILEFAKANKNVTLLLGNHDCEYMIGTYVCECRCDYFYFDEIRNLFLENKNLFSFATIRQYGNGKPYLFSHAGFNPTWVKYHDLVIEDLCDRDFETVMNEQKNFDAALADISSYRGGYNMAGSMVWCDITELLESKEHYEKYHQIIGHTYLKKQPIGDEYFTCVDLQRIFLLDSEGKPFEKDMTPAAKISFPK